MHKAVVIPAAVALVACVAMFESSIASPARCSLVEGKARLLVRVERDTMLPVLTEPDANDRDTLLARRGTLLPAARVRILRADGATLAALLRAGVADSFPEVLLASAPYGADCNLVRWTDSAPFAVPGEVGYVRAHLYGEVRMIGRTPVFTVPDYWNYPYPRRRGLARNRSGALASAEAMYEFQQSIGHLQPPLYAEYAAPGDTAVSNAIATWARSHTATAELEPFATYARSALLRDDVARISAHRSRLRGSYRVIVSTDSARAERFFRTTDRPLESWRSADSLRTIANILARPFAVGYTFHGRSFVVRDSLPTEGRQLLGGDRNARPPAAFMFNAADNPSIPATAPFNSMRAELLFDRRVMPELFWNALDTFRAPARVFDSAYLTERFGSYTRGDHRMRIPLTLRAHNDGRVVAETTVVSGRNRLVIRIERMDTVSVRRPY